LNLKPTNVLFLSDETMMLYREGRPPSMTRTGVMMRPIKYFHTGALVLFILISVGVLPPAAHSSSPKVKADTAVKQEDFLRVTITRPAQRSSPRTFQVPLICDTNATRIKGLQGFRRLEKDEAALFVFEKSLVISFWMGSVAYPIDIIFVNPKGKVVRVYANCKPGSRVRYPSLELIQWVIETAAGSGIRTGDRVRFK
jgi:uncharacterized membrane protein (UPF0127 family)